MKYKKYPSYKDSGISWLGEIPERWNQRKIKHFAQTIPGGTPSTIEPEYWDGDIPWLPSGAVQNCIINEDRVIKFITKKGLYNSATKYIKPNSTLIALTGATCGNIGYLTFQSTANQSVVGIVTQKSTSDKYVFYSLISQKSQILVKRTGGAQAGINEQDVKDIFISYPPIQEQQQIADFLDKATAKIDTLIEKQTKQIELLKEKRQAVISHAVTKGINPNVPMKDSGVEWLGEIPEHWKIIPLRHLGQLQNGVSKGSDYFGSGYPFINYGDIYNNDIIPSQINGFAQSSLEDRIAYSVKKGDIFFTRTSETIHDIGMASTCLQTIPNATFSGFTIRFRQLKEVLIPSFSRYQFRSGYSQSFFVKEMNLVTRASLGQDLLKRLHTIVPPLKEQQQIANYLDEKTSKIDILIEKSNKSIELLKEKRTALISAAVTGKIDVREFE